MGYDNISIISMNSSRKGLMNLSRGARGSYLRDILEGMEPHICLLPGDDDELNKNVVVNYGQFMSPQNDKTVLLYDYNKVEMKQPSFRVETMCNDLHGFDLNKIVCPFVEAKALKPVPSVLKRFSVITWKYDLFSTTGTVQQTLMESIVTFSQRLAMATGAPILIAGEMTLDMQSVEAIVKKLSRDGNEAYLKSVQPEFENHGFLPSMTSGSQTPIRHLFKLQVFKCQQTVVKTWEKSREKETISDCFIASKDLVMSNAEFVNMDKVCEKTGKKIQMDILKKYCPTKTEMSIPSRPPRHHGG